MTPKEIAGRRQKRNNRWKRNKEGPMAPLEIENCDAAVVFGVRRERNKQEIKGAAERLSKMQVWCCCGRQGKKEARI